MPSGDFHLHLILQEVSIFLCLQQLVQSIPGLWVPLFCHISKQLETLSQTNEHRVSKWSIQMVSEHSFKDIDLNLTNNFGQIRVHMYDLCPDFVFSRCYAGLH